MKHTFLCIFVILCYQFAGATTKQSVVIIHNPMKLEYSIQLEISNAVILESQQEIDTVSVDNPIYNTELHINVYFGESWIDRTVQINADTVVINISDTLITAPNSEYNIELDAYIKFIRATNSRDSMELYSNEELEARENNRQRLFEFKYPCAENTLAALAINGRCERISFAYMDSIAASWDSLFFVLYPLAKKVLRLRDRKSYSNGDEFPISAFIAAKEKKLNANQLRLIMISEPGCGATEYWLQMLEKHPNLFAEQYYFHIESVAFDSAAPTPGFKDVFVKDGAYNENLLGLHACATPYFVVLDEKNIIKFFGRGGDLFYGYIPSLK
jgi:hypothetical protein